MENSRITDVLHFWFEEIQPETWFRRDPELDAVIRRRFLILHGALKAENIEKLNTNPRSALASVIVFDQFPRNMFRDAPEAFATDPQARRLATAAIEARFDEQLDPHGRQFLYMPFMHSEDRGDQERSMVLFESLALAEPLASAKAHKDIVDRFGRFPHRNAVLGRVSTPAEIEFVKTTKNF